ncbi:MULTISPECIES: hypothetical protein [Helicobacter]|uniref:CDP-Glycerol:Poly(Glycerophosphate) glycerophosphotransferase n=1 Tax=Helicobacter ibis TaxID=2962633 RepID=A0ABT4VC86_9HELI|nr:MULTISPECIES: hypothetical protein [Helicobacter]MDA3967567.1 hypothetical protein [Helicobacter sp. WB40]MDA3968318.1 hypothetical protein [Helicobacter ibis]
MGYKKDSIRFIDDNNEDTSLKNIAPKITSNDVLLLATRANFINLGRKLAGLKLNFVDGASFVAKKLDEYFYNLGYRQHNTIAVLTYGPSGSKHRGNVEHILKNNGINIVFLCQDENELKKAEDRIGDSVAFILNEGEILRRISFFGFIFSECHEYLSPDVFVGYIPHTFASPNQGIAYDKIRDSAESRMYLENNDFIFSSCLKTHYTWQEVCNYAYLKDLGADLVGFSKFYKVLPFGAPTIDRYKDIEFVLQDNTILVCFNLIYTSFEFANNVVSKLLDSGYKVIYRPHINQQNNKVHLKINENFKQNINFTYDVSVKLSLDVISSRPLLITDISSLCYTYPIATLRPCIMCLSKESEDKFEVFIERKIQKIAHTYDEILKLCESILQNDIDDEVLKYTQNEIFNFGNSSQKIADFILELLNVLSFRKRI